MPPCPCTLSSSCEHELRHITIQLQFLMKRSHLTLGKLASKCEDQPGSERADPAAVMTRVEAPMFDLNSFHPHPFPLHSPTAPSQPPTKRERNIPSLAFIIPSFLLLILPSPFPVCRQTYLYHPAFPTIFLNDPHNDDTRTHSFPSPLPPTPLYITNPVLVVGTSPVL